MTFALLASKIANKNGLMVLKQTQELLNPLDLFQ